MNLQVLFFSTALPGIMNWSLRKPVLEQKLKYKTWILLKYTVPIKEAKGRMKELREFSKEFWKLFIYNDALLPFKKIICGFQIFP